MVLYLFSSLIGATALVYCKCELYGNRSGKKPGPLYFRLFFWAQCSYFLASLSDFVNALCGDFEYSFLTVGQLGYFGAFLAMFFANYKHLDSIIDEKDLPVGAGSRRKAFAAPAVLAAYLIVLFILWSSRHFLYGLAVVFVLLPVVGASYYHLKHLLMPMDALRLLEGTNNCNFLALLLYPLRATYYLALFFRTGAVPEILSAIAAIMMSGITISAVKGAKRWIF